jgi:hypothetical protein
VAKVLEQELARDVGRKLKPFGINAILTEIRGPGGSVYYRARRRSLKDKDDALEILLAQQRREVPAPSKRERE